MSGPKKQPRPTPPPPGAPVPAGSNFALYLVGGIALLSVLGVAFWLFWPRSLPSPTPTARIVTKATPFVMEDQAQTYAQYAGSASCKDCHADAYAKWAVSNHGMAERPLRPDLDLAAFQPRWEKAVAAIVYPD